MCADDDGLVAKRGITARHDADDVLAADLRALDRDAQVDAAPRRQAARRGFERGDRDACRKERVGDHPSHRRGEQRGGCRRALELGQRLVDQQQRAGAVLARGDELLDTRNTRSEPRWGAREGERDPALHVDTRVVIVAVFWSADAVPHEDDLGVDLALGRPAMRGPVRARDRRGSAHDLERTAGGDAHARGDHERLKE